MGMIYVEVTSDPIAADRVLNLLNYPAHGAHNLFLGVVRDHHLGKKVLGVSYDIFEPLAEVVFKNLCGEAQQKWGSDLSCVMIHRTGRLGIGEASVAIAVASVHRAECYAASRYLIDELKMRAPIWKQEHYEEGESAWLSGHALCGHIESSGESLQNKFTPDSGPQA